ncbi:MAG: universal stress protein [Rhodanobacter sp.]
MSNRTAATPTAILLATDLSARCDRALDRAALLSAQWRVPLHVVHATAADTASPWPAIDTLRAPADGDIEPVRQRIVGDLRSDVPELVVHVQRGRAAEVILEVAERERCQLIVLGDARDTLSRQLLGSTVTALVRTAPVSVLIVKRRPRGAYRNVLVGTDFTVESRLGLLSATDLFAHAQFTVLHALDIPYRSLWLDDAHRDDFTRLEQATMDAFITDAGVAAEPRQRLHSLVEHGHAEAMLRQHALDHDADLCVIGAVRRGLPFHLLIGSTSHRIVQSMPTDILVVRAAAATPAAQPDESSRT